MSTITSIMNIPEQPMYCLSIVSATDPLKEFNVSMSFNYIKLINKIYEHIEDFLDDAEEDILAFVNQRKKIVLDTPYTEDIEEVLLNKFNEANNTKYDSIQDLYKVRYGTRAEHAPYNSVMGELIEIDQYSSFDYHYYISKIEQNDGIYEQTIYEH